MRMMIIAGKKIELKAKICSHFVYHPMIILAFDAVTGKA